MFGSLHVCQLPRQGHVAKQREEGKGTELHHPGPFSHEFLCRPSQSELLELQAATGLQPCVFLHCMQSSPAP